MSDEQEVTDHNEERIRLSVELDETMRECTKREKRMASIEEEILQINYQLDKLRKSPGILNGDARVIVSREAFKRSLLLKLDRQKVLLVEANDEVLRARERKEMIEQDIEDSEDSVVDVEEIVESNGENETP